MEAAVTATCRDALKVKKDTEGQDRHSQSHHACLEEVWIEVALRSEWTKQANLIPSSRKWNLLSPATYMLQSMDIKLLKKAVLVLLVQMERLSYFLAEAT